MSYTTMIKKKNLKKRPSLLEGTIEKLQELISRGGYMPGDKLPSERELVEEFGVSRTVLREAIRSIEASGLVTVYPGKGVFVSEQNIDDLIIAASFLESPEPGKYKKSTKPNQAMYTEYTRNIHNKGCS